VIPVGRGRHKSREALLSRPTVDQPPQFHPEPSAFAFGIAAVSLLVLPVLGTVKLHLGRQLQSPALSGDGVLTTAAAALAAVTLLALAANSILDWWWADPVAALLIAIALATEATRVAVRHRFG
jgi:divalent metal cation (Fe/Co/Zn/Cd) transporter